MTPKDQTASIPIGTDHCVVPDVNLGPILSPLPPYRSFDWNPLRSMKARWAPPGQER